MSGGEPYVKNDTHAGLIIRLVLTKHNTRPRCARPRTPRITSGRLGYSWVSSVLVSYEYARRNQCHLLRMKHSVLANGNMQERSGR